MKKLTVYLPERFRRTGAFYGEGTETSRAESWKPRPVVRRSGAFFNVSRATERFAANDPGQAVVYLKNQWESYRLAQQTLDQDARDVTALVETLQENVSVSTVDGQPANAFRGLALLREMVELSQESSVFAGRADVLLAGLNALEQDLASRG